MSLSIGIVGLPNVGKSTLFTALTNKGGLAANYPFATIEPNVGVVPVPDARLDALAAIDDPARIVPATVEFVDIAGLVAGASQGEGLGNQFLANIRETDAICEVVRFFGDPDVVHVSGRVDPLSDVETIKTELILADLATLQSRFGRITDLTVGLCGDLTFGRTVHSLIETLCRFGNVRFVLISPDELKTPQYVIDRINATDNCSYVEVRDLASVIGDLDVLYMTRVQKERFFNEDDYLRLRDTYILDEEKLQLAKPSMAVLHPLPRVNEIAVDVDDDPRAAYFEQVKNGMLVRMALESTVVGDELPGYEPLNPKEVQA